jgi:hypothetical protein
MADGREPGSLLVYPIHRSGAPFGSQAWFTVASVTNSNLDLSLGMGGRKGGDTTVQFEYVNIVPNPTNSFMPLNCFVVDRTEFLTPADTLSVLTSCHNAAGNQEGYLVVYATNPDRFKTAWSFNYLLGSEMVITELGGLYSLNAIPFNALGAAKMATDLNFNNQRDFDGMEYEGVADELYIDNFLAISGSSLTLINLTGGVNYTATVRFDVWNDNEFPLSAIINFKCWFEEPLETVSLVFQEAFLRGNTPNDPTELDINCDGIGDFETGWARVTGIVATSSASSIMDPALLGAVTAGPESRFFDGGHELWESSAKQLNGSFLGFGN